MADQQQWNGWGQPAPAAAPTAPTPVGHCPNPDGHYFTEVNKGSINMRHWQVHLADMYKSGYRLAHAFEQDGNTVQVFEHHFHH